MDACSEIVDRAQKELNIEKQLKKIEDTWAGLNFGFTQYQDTDVMALVVRGGVAGGARGAATTPPGAWAQVCCIVWVAHAAAWSFGACHCIQLAAVVVQLAAAG